MTISLTTSSLKRVVCGISGGVDSAVAAWLLKQKGFKVIGAFMKNWDALDEHGTCTRGQNDLDDARDICQFLGIELVEVNFVKEYWNNVFTTLLTEYENGLTPNPDVACNRFIKFGAFYRYAMKNLNAQAIATGHYARTSFGPFLENYQSDKNVLLKTALDISKDQTLFLSQVEQKPLRHTMFPLGNLYKTHVRQLACNIGMKRISKKRDSTGICFIGKRKFTDFINEYLPDKTGPFVEIETGKIVGWHKGVHHWTLGQGCNIGGRNDRLFVAERDPTTQTIYVASGTGHPSLHSNILTTLKPHWISTAPEISSSVPFTCMFKFQHTLWTVPCQILALDGGGLSVKISFPTRAISPGQYAVFYQGDVCLGGAKIISRNTNIRKYISQHRETSQVDDSGLHELNPIPMPLKQ